MHKIAVLIPCYNEAQTIEKVVTDFKNTLPEATIFVYDNNSSDQTSEIALAAGAEVCCEYRQGKGNVIRSMFRDIDADCYLMIDGDDTYPAEFAPQMAELVLSGRADMVIGDRLSSTCFTENKRPFHNFGNRLVRFLINRLFSGSVQDIMTGYRAFSRAFVKAFPISSKGFEIETEMTIHALDNNFLIREIPVAYRDRPAGSVSKLNTYRDGMRVLKTITKLFRDFRPLAFFGIIAALLVLIGFGAFLPVLIEYVKTGLVLKFPTLIVSMFTMVSGILSFAIGLILTTIYKVKKDTYECCLNQLKYLDDIKNQLSQLAPQPSVTQSADGKKS